jgi:hypothetical protein
MALAAFGNWRHAGASHIQPKLPIKWKRRNKIETVQKGMVVMNRKEIFMNSVFLGAIARDLSRGTRDSQLIALRAERIPVEQIPLSTDDCRNTVGWETTLKVKGIAPGCIWEP